MEDCPAMSKISRMATLLRTHNLMVTVDNRRRVKDGRPRRLLSRPTFDTHRPSARRINAIYRGIPGARSYLEIGLQRGRTFEQVRVPRRVGVEPFPMFAAEKPPKCASIIVSTSDEFFNTLNATTTFDLVFLDGLHTYRQTYTDLINALAVCPSGVVMIDDVVPTDPVSAMPDLEESMAERARRGLEGTQWHGDVYKVMLAIHEFHPELRVRTMVGPDNAQALVWRDDDVAAPSAVDVPLLNRFAETPFEAVFHDGPPAYFTPCSESQAIADAVAAVSHRFALG